MHRIFCLVLLSLGTVLVIYGLNSPGSIVPALSHLLQGAPTDRAVWFLIGGANLLLLGVGGLVIPARRRRR